MFTGIVEELGSVQAVETRSAGALLRLRCRTVLEDLVLGASVCINGVCLTAVDITAEGFAAEVSPETLTRSTLGSLRPNSPVNLERALAASGRLGGHIVQGHVDSTGEFLSLDALGDGNYWLTVKIPPEVDRYVVFKGSLAIDGISLTVAKIEEDRVSATVLPFTYKSTTLGSYRRGARVNLECDILAKYVEKMLGGLREARPAMTMERLRDLGY